MPVLYVTDRASLRTKEKRLRNKCNIVLYHLENIFGFLTISFKNKHQDTLSASDAQKLKICSEKS